MRMSHIRGRAISCMTWGLTMTTKGILDAVRDKGLPWWPVIMAAVTAIAVSASTTASSTAKTTLTLEQHEARLDRFDGMAEDRGARLVRTEQSNIEINRRLERVEQKIDILIERQ